MPALKVPTGKPAGVPCVQLDADLRCTLFGRPERPPVCASLAPHASMCRDDRAQALAGLTWLEVQTAPAPSKTMSRLSPG